MYEKISPISRAVSDVLTGAYKKRRLTQEAIAAESGFALVTLQKKLRGTSPVSATDLVLIARAIGTEPAEILQEALNDLEAASEAPVSLDQRRDSKAKSIDEMTTEEIESIPEKAATYDPELDQDEPYGP